MFLKKKLYLKKHILTDFFKEKGGSYSIEAALSLSVFTALMMMLISLIPIVQVKAVIGHAANEVSMELSERAYDTEKFFEEKGEWRDTEDWCREMIRERLKTESRDPCGWLRKKGIKEGLYGLDFTGSEILDGDSEIDISLEYEIEIEMFGFVEKNIRVKKEAKTKAWLPYDFSFESIEEKEGKGIWQQNNFVRGKYFVKKIKALQGEKAVKSGQGIDLYDTGTGTVSEIFSMNIFSSSYLLESTSGGDPSGEAFPKGEAFSGEQEINTDAVLKQFEKYIEDFEYDIATLGDTLEMENGKRLKPEIKKKELIVIFPLEAQSPVYSGVLDAIFIELNELYGMEATIYYLEEAKV